MVCAPVRLIIPLLKLRDYLSVQAHKPCSISHMFLHKKHIVTELQIRKGIKDNSKIIFLISH